MQPWESILYLQKRFSHLANHLKALGKTFSNDDLNLKIVRSLTRKWQTKVTTIWEKKSLSKTTSATLFKKLQEHEIELERLEKHEVKVMNSKYVALNTRVKNNDSCRPVKKYRSAPHARRYNRDTTKLYLFQRKEKISIKPKGKRKKGKEVGYASGIY